MVEPKEGLSPVKYTGTRSWFSEINEGLAGERLRVKAAA
jgi:hypothetical protein